MADMFARIDLMEGAANRTYRLVLERYPKSAKLLRSYGRFLENVKNDPWGAARYYAEAEKQACGGGGGGGLQRGTATVEKGARAGRKRGVCLLTGQSLLPPRTAGQVCVPGRLTCLSL
jgi:hypothetical protein